jgi:hypothetical protein
MYIGEQAGFKNNRTASDFTGSEQALEFQQAA